MAIYPVQSFQNLVDAINNATDGDEIQLTAELIVLSAALPTITRNLTITSVSRNTTISGGGNFQVFRVNGGNVTFSNLTIANGLARGANGTFNNNTTGNTTGGDGRAGLGGGLFLNSGSVTLVNTTFQNNTAQGGNGGGSARGTGGNAGGGQGGAIYVNNGVLRINNTIFRNNAAVAGQPGTGSQGSGATGFSQGGAIYVSRQGSVIAEGSPQFSNNFARRDVNVSGPEGYDYQVVTRPFVQLIERSNPNPTAATRLNYTVRFSQDVTDVDESDFRLVTTGNVTGAGIVAVTPAPGSSSIYTVSVNAGTGNGTIRLDLRDDDSIKNSSSVPLGGTGANNGSFAGQIYTINRTPPTVSIIRKNNAPEQTAADIVFYTMFFNEPVNGIDTDAAGGFKNFQVLGGLAGAQILSVKPLSAASSNTAYEVQVRTGSGNGNLRLKLIDDDRVRNRRNVPLGGVGLSNGDVFSPIYAINKTPPTVSAIERLGNSPTGDGQVSFRVLFSQEVQGVTRDDFVPAVNGIRGAGVAAVTRVDGRTYTVVLNTGSGDGTLGLNLIDNDSIRNSLGVALGGRGNGNGNAGTETPYTVIKSAPLVSAINRASANPTAAATVSFSVTFNQAVTGVTKDDFRLFGTDVTGFSIIDVTGSGQTYQVTANTGNGSGSLGLNLIDNDSIRNSVGVPLGGRGVSNGNFSGQAFTITKTPPRVTAINRLGATSTNESTLRFTVSFNEAVANVDPSDFLLETVGLTGAGITNVTRVNDSFYSVEVTTGRGEGTIGLNLVDNDTIRNSLGLVLGGAGVNNGSFRGEVYSIDRTVPTVDILDVAPDPRRDTVDAITIRFSEAVRGFELTDLQLTRNGNPVALNAATLTSADSITWTLGNLRKPTSSKGDYSLLLPASGSGITDLAGNALTTSSSERWVNLVSIEACDPGITRRGSNGNNRLQGTADNDVLIGLAGNDVLTGLDCRDRLVGGRGNDLLLGGEGRDVLLGGAGNDQLNGGTEADLLNGGTGADRFIYSGSNQASALANSLVDAPDQIQRFKFSESDKFQLDFDDNLKSRERPSGLFNAGRVRGRTLEQAVRNAYRNKNQESNGSQRLGANEAVFLSWRGGTYLSVNDRTAAFAAERDLVINVSGIQLRSGDANAGSLSVSNYFA